MTQKLSDDIYIILYYDKSEGDISLAIAEDIPAVKEYMKTYQVISWANITGKNMEMSEFQVLGELKINDEVTVTQVEPKQGKKKNDKRK